MKTTKKALLLTVCALVLVAATIMGTMAYLTAQDTVVNTFVAGKLIEKDEDFMLKEHKAVRQTSGSYELGEDLVQANEYVVIPGKNLPKDPFVSVKVQAAGYLFVEVVDKMPETMTWAIDDTQWTQLMDGSDPVLKEGNPVYFYKNGPIAPAEDPLTINILKDQQVVVSPDLDVDALSTADDVAAKTLSFNGYLIQAEAEGFDSPLAAWAGMVAELAKP